MKFLVFVAGIGPQKIFIAIIILPVCLKGRIDPAFSYSLENIDKLKFSSVLGKQEFMIKSNPQIHRFESNSDVIGPFIVSDL